MDSETEVAETEVAQMEREKARFLTKKNLDKANSSFHSILNNDGSVKYLAKVELGGPFLDFANENLEKGVVSFIPFDKFRKSDDDNVGRCREGTFNECEIDSSCTEKFSNATLFAAGYEELSQKILSLGKNYKTIEASLGLNYSAKNTHVIVFKILDGIFVRIPCSKYPSLLCNNRCEYPIEDLPLDLCDKDNLRDKYPQLSNTIDNMGLCEPGGMPFKGVGETPGHGPEPDQGLKEYVVYMGPTTKGEIISVETLDDFHDRLQQEQQQSIQTSKRVLKRRGAMRDLSNIMDGGNKRKKYKKTKKRRSKKSSKKRRSRKKRSKKRRSRKKYILCRK